MREIQLTRGLVALVDDEDYDRINSFKWSAGRDHKRNCWYAHRRINGSTISMHRDVLHSDGQVDHVDGDGLNNQKANLRACTPQQNSFNRRPHRGSKSGMKGVYCGPKRGRAWIASITKDGEQIHLGSFDNKEDAAIAYDNAARRYFGEFAWLNYPERTA